MDITAINDAIQELENSETTQENVLELASLYTVRNNIQVAMDPVQSELTDIFPYYLKYRQIKQKYQRNQAIDYEVIQGIKDVCQELKEFVETLYNHTDMHKERMCIKKAVQELAEKYKD